MKKLTKILSLNFSANFLSEENKDGSILNAFESQIIRFIPFDNILKITNSVKGVFVENLNGIQLFLPLIFENNTIDDSVLSNLPDELNFYIQTVDVEKFAYSGLSIDNKKNNLLYLTPKNTSKEYILNGKTIVAKPCGKGNVISASDMLVYISADITLDDLMNLTGNSFQNITNLKIELGNKQVIVPLKGDISELHNLLLSFINKTALLKIKNNADDSVLKEFTEVLVTKSGLPKNVIGIVSIPKNSIKSNEPDYGKYIDLNHFVTHFPGAKTKLEIEISVSSFENSDKLFIDGKSVSFTVLNHPSLVNWKKVSCSVENYFIYLFKQKNIVLKTGNKVFGLPVNPILTYDSKTSISKIYITKNIN